MHQPCWATNKAGLGLGLGSAGPPPHVQERLLYKELFYNLESAQAV